MSAKSINCEKIDRLIKQRNYIEANQEIDKLLTYHKYDQGLNIRKIEVLSKLGEFQEAKIWIDKSKRILKDHTENMKGILEENKLYINKALKHYKKALLINDNDSALIKIARLLEDIGDLEQAKNYYTEAEKTKSRVYALLGKGRIAIREDKLDLTEQYFKTIYEEGNKIDYGIRNLMIFNIYKGDMQKAYDYMCMLPIASKQDISSTARIEDFYLRYQLGLINDYEFDEKDYLRLQIIDYDKERFYLRYENVKDYVNENSFSFTIESIEKFKELFENIEIAIQKKTPIGLGVTNKYVIKFPEIVGKSELTQKTTDKLLVSVVANTTNIVNTYPIPDYYDSYLENKEEIEKYHTPVQRTRESQIDKFNKRYTK